jgi:hypothetical protein
MLYSIISGLPCTFIIRYCLVYLKLHSILYKCIIQYLTHCMMYTNTSDIPLYFTVCTDISANTHQVPHTIFFPTEQLDVDSCVQLTGWAGYSELWRSATWWAQAVQSPCSLQLQCCFVEDLCPWSCPKHILRSCRCHQWTSLINIYIHQSVQVESWESLLQHINATLQK